MRPRRSKFKGLAPYLYAESKQTKQGIVTYYRYKHPKTGQSFAFGTDRKKANAAAHQLNAQLLPGADLVGMVLGTANQTFNKVIDEFIEKYPKCQLGTQGAWSEGTRREHLYRFKRYRADLGHRLIAEYSLSELNTYLEMHFSGDGHIQNRNLLIHLYKFAVAKGYVDDNYAEKTLRPVKAKRQRKRLTLEQFKAIREIAPEWLQNAMDLSLITLQARAEVLNIRFSDYRDGYVYIVRKKTKDKTDRAYIKIKAGAVLKAVIKRCRLSGMVCPYLIHRQPKKMQRPRKALKVNDKLLSTTFKETRDATGLFNRYKLAERPTFHEIRSLGGRLLEQSGYGEDIINKLYAHTTLKMTQHYLKDDEIHWQECEAPLDLDNLLN